MLVLLLKGYTHSRKHSTTESSDGDVTLPLNAVSNLISGNFRRNSVSLPSGLDKVDSEAIHRPDDKIRRSVSSKTQLYYFYDNSR